MEAWLFIAAVLTCVMVLYVVRYPRANLQPFLARPCQGRFWRRAFPNTPKSEIRVFLSLFGESFGFKARHLLKFKPDDGLLVIYRARYPEQWMPDALELEVFQRMLSSKYGLHLQTVWHDQLTLREIFDLTQRGGNEA